MPPELIHAEKGPRPMGETVVIDRHLYLTEDKQRVVEEGDPAGRWLWASPGQEVSRAQAEYLGAIRPAVPAVSEEVVVEVAEPEPPAADEPAEEPEPAPEPDPEVKAEPKKRQPAANKARTRPADK